MAGPAMRELDSRLGVAWITAMLSVVKVFPGGTRIGDRGSVLRVLDVTFEGDSPNGLPLRSVWTRLSTSKQIGYVSRLAVRIRSI